MPRIAEIVDACDDKGIVVNSNVLTKSDGLLKLRKGLQSAKQSTKGIGGVDKEIAAILGLLDYGVFGESPVNAILKAIGALVGYSAGFAIGAPFGGVPGFITGMAGGWVGEKAADLILGNTPLNPEEIDFYRYLD